MRGWVAAFAACRQGGIIPMAAAGVPLVALMVIAATELSSVSSEKTRMQDTVDAVALDAAIQLSASPPDSVVARARANASRQLANMEPRTTLVVDAVNVENGIRVTVDGTRLSFFGNMLPPGGFKTSVQATALNLNTAPLCVVALNASERIKVHNAAEIDAGECLVHSNGEIETGSGGRLRAYAIQSGGAAKGTGITPAAATGAKTIADPFASVPFRLPTGCVDKDRKFDKAGIKPLPAGRHCGHVDIEGTTVRLTAGIHVFNGEVQLKKGTRLEGLDTLIVFEKGAKFKFDSENVRLDLQGLKTGDPSVHGFVFATTADRTEEVELPAGHIERLEGVVYVPAAKLKITQGKDIVTETVDALLDVGLGAKSKWTVVVAKGLEATDNASIVVNADYLASSVPVPAGVGDKVGRETRLAR